MLQNAASKTAERGLSARVRRLFAFCLGFSCALVVQSAQVAGLVVAEVAEPAAAATTAVPRWSSPTRHARVWRDDAAFIEAVHDAYMRLGAPRKAVGTLAGALSSHESAEGRTGWRGVYPPFPLQSYLFTFAVLSIHLYGIVCAALGCVSI